MQQGNLLSFFKKPIAAGGAAKSSEKKDDAVSKPAASASSASAAVAASSSSKTDGAEKTKREEKIIVEESNKKARVEIISSSSSSSSSSAAAAAAAAPTLFAPLSPRSQSLPHIQLGLSFSSSSPPLRRLPNGLRLFLVEDDITTVKTDIVVTPSEPYLQSIIGVAGALFKREGTGKIQEECKEYKKTHPEKLRGGDVVATTGGSLHFHRVLHAVIPSFSSATGSTPLAHLTQKILAMASQHLAVSVALPALGAGAGGFGPQRSAEGILQGMMDFDVSQFPEGRLSDVVIVVNNATYSTFKSVFAPGAAAATSTSTKVVVVEKTSSTKTVVIEKKSSSDDNEEEEEEENSASASAAPRLTHAPSLHSELEFYAPLSRSSSYDSNPSCQILATHLTMGSQNLLVVRHDICQEPSDAIVNAANARLQHAGGLARAIVKQGGEEIQEESNQVIKERGKINTGELAVTGAGSLKCRFILHTVGPIWGQQSDEQSDALLKKCILNILNEAHKRRLFSISIPAISSGIYGFPKKRCAQIIVSSTVQWCNEWMDSSLREIRFTNIDSETSDIFKNYFHSKFGSLNS